MLGPVMMMNSAESRTSSTSFGMNVMSSWASRHGWREALRMQSPPPFLSTLGLTYGIGALTEISAKLKGDWEGARSSENCIRQGERSPGRNLGRT